MKNSNVTGVVFLVLGVAACSVHIGTDGGSSPPPRTAAAPPPPAAHPAPPPPAPPPPAAHPAMGRLPAAPAVAAAPAAGGAHHVAPAAQFSNAVNAPLNVARIQESIKRNPKACGWVEPVPGHFVKIDCHTYAPSAKAVPHLSMRKARMASNHQLHWKPIKFTPNALRNGLAGGFGKPAPAGGERASGAAPGSNNGLVKADAFPGQVDHMAENLEGPVKDQGPVGACTAFSLSGTIDNQAVKAGKMTAGSREDAASPNHVWSGYGIPQMGTAADANLGRTIAKMSIWPQSDVESCKLANPDYETDCGFETHVQPGTWRQDPALMDKYNKSESGGAYKVAGFEKLQTLPASTEELKTTLASGNSLWIAMKIDGYAWSNSKMRNGVIPDWDSPTGGHAIEMVGFRDTPSGTQYKIKNSWGTSWGDQGGAWVSENMVQKFMHYAYKVKLDGVPAQPGSLTDDDCSPDELVDLVSGLCALICPGDSRPSNGCGAFGGGQKK